MIYFLPGDFWIRFKLCTLLFHSTLSFFFELNISLFVLGA